MPEYINPNPFTVHLTGPDGKTIKVRSKRRIILSEYFDRYRSRGFIRLAGEHDSIPSHTQRRKPTNIQSKIRLSNKPTNAELKPDIQQSEAQKHVKKERRRAEELKRARKIASKVRQSAPTTRITGKRLVVGRRLAADATKMFNDNLAKDYFPVSNNIGVGILSYNRVESLKRLVESIRKNTDLRKTTVFISDDASKNPELVQYLKQLSKSPHFSVILNEHRGGIAVNTNRLIRCLSRFQYGLILNDDVEVLKGDWEYLYVDAMQKTGMHHFCYRQEGVYGAKLGDETQSNGISLRMVDKRPQGAVLAFSRDMLVKAGYFDESYGYYGMEHVDWSMKAWETGLQKEGFFDVVGSEDYFKLNKDKSVVDDRSQLLRDARKRFESRTGGRIGPTAASKVPEITYVIPFRNVIGRDDSIRTVVKNIRAHRFPVIHIILVEQDSATRINLNNYLPVQYYIAQETRGDKYALFNKSMAFNLGVSKATTESVILHDADIITQSRYTQVIWDVLQRRESCHLGSTVMYASNDSTRVINSTGEVDKECKCDRAIEYFEGGSLACHVKAYWKVGGFNEDFWGYGCEDCDFYARLFSGSTWMENRVFDFLHLWHGRVQYWDDHHEINKKIEARLKAMPMTDRIALQYNQLRRIGYKNNLDGALS